MILYACVLFIVSLATEVVGSRSHSSFFSSLHAFKISRLEARALESRPHYKLNVIDLITLRGGASKRKKNVAQRKNHPVHRGDDDDTDISQITTDASKGKKKKEIRLQDILEEENTSMEEDDSDNVVLATKFPTTPLKLLSSFMDIVEKTPPMTRYLLATSCIITALSKLFNKNQWPSFLHFEWMPILFQFQWWRILSAFLYFGPLDIFYPLTLQFVWQHMGQLERLSSKSPEDFFVMTIFGGTALIFLYPLLGISMKFLGHNLATYYVYIWARTFEGADVNFMDLFTLKAEVMPWFFCLQTFLLEQEVPFADLIGIIVGHLYYYLNNKKILQIPEYVRSWFRTPIMRRAYMKFYDAIE